MSLCNVTLYVLNLDWNAQAENPIINGLHYIHDEIGLKVQQFERKKEAGFQQAHPS